MPKSDFPPLDYDSNISDAGFTHFTLCLKQFDNSKKLKVKQINADQIPLIDNVTENLGTMSNSQAPNHSVIEEVEGEGGDHNIDRVCCCLLLFRKCRKH